MFYITGISQQFAVLILQ